MINFPFMVNELMQFLGSMFRKDGGADDFVDPTPHQDHRAAPTPTMKPPEMTDEDYAKVIEMGLQDWGKGSAPPMATQSASLAKLGSELPERYLPAALSIKETGALSNSESARVKNNPYGIGPGVQYPDLETATLGGGPENQRGLKGVLLGREGEPSKYKKYLDSGDLGDFFDTYTPDSDPRNPKNDEQVAMMNQLLDKFMSAEEKYKKEKGFR